MGAVSKLRAALRSDGLVSVLGRIRRRVIAFPEFVVFEKTIAPVDPPPPMRPTDLDVEFSWLEASQLEELNDRDLEFDDRTLARAAAWLRRGDVCLVGRMDGRIAHYHFVARAVREHPHAQLTLGPQVVASYKSFTRIEYRKQGLSARAHAISEAAMAALGARHWIREAAAENEPSRRAALKDGCREVGRFRHLKIGRYRKALFSPRLRDLYRR